MEIARKKIKDRCNGTVEEQEYYTINFFKYLSDRNIDINTRAEEIQNCFIDFALGTLPDGSSVKYKERFDIILERANRRADMKNKEIRRQKLLGRNKNG
jgi:hypothetical protein